MENSKTQKVKNKKSHKNKNPKNHNSSEDSFLKIEEYNSTNKSSETIQDENSINLNYIDTTIYDNPDYYGILPGVPYINGFEAYSYPHLINPFAQKIPIKTLRNNEYIYVNSKQYSRILKRREARKKYFEMFENDILLNKKVKYHHESRHKHAMNRKRGKGGRFLSKDDINIINGKNKEKEDYINNCIFINGNLNEK
jgi:hypothetical protein